ncbi:P22 phage major capsid protein family protein [Acinetobacter sp. MN12]|uniref:P22 phage major capsid protein family protein n=1 Tax=Acinetobacter sp. MN12 TaxID=1513354 RepID=UPI00051BD841|nr:P22 phage major capsid protein family protein [Acinetobacter sp. MN12]
MANNFSKEERVMFDKVMIDFDDNLVISRAATNYGLGSPQDSERKSDRDWLPMPYGAITYDGIDQTGNFGDITQLAVPVGLGIHKSAPGLMTSKNLRDPMQLQRYGDAAKKKLASDINYSLFVTAAMQGSVVSKVTANASGYDDVALIDAQLTEIGVGTQDRVAFYSPRDYNKMAGDLAKRQTVQGKVQTAYEKAYIGEIAGFETYKNDQTLRLAAATATGVTINGANQRYVPIGSTTDAAGNTTNIDNRYQTISITVTSGTVKVGDAITIAGVNSVHHITKQDTGQLKTFRITEIVTGAGGTGTVKITPPIIAADSSPTRAELQYKNVTAAPSNGAVVTFLNTATAALNPFFVKESLVLIPGSFTVDAQDGWQVMRAVTDQGIAITYARQGDINNFNVKYRWDVDYGVGLLNTEMAGIQLFNQT